MCRDSPYLYLLTQARDFPTQHPHALYTHMHTHIPLNNTTVQIKLKILNSYNIIHNGYFVTNT